MARRLPTDEVPNRPHHPVRGMQDELEGVMLQWQISEVHSPQTYARMTETVHRFAARLAAQGIGTFAAVTAEHAAAFVLAPTSEGRRPEVNTEHARRTAVRTLYKTLRRLDHPVGDPTLDLVLPPRGLKVARPLTDDEVTLARASAQAMPGRRGWMRATAWALGEAGAVSSEITAVRVSDLNDPDNPQHVHLPGTRRLRPCRVELTPWAHQVIAYRVMTLRRAGRGGPGTLLTYGGATPPGGAKAQATVCNALRDVLNSAGLSGESDVRPSSLRHWVGRRAFDAGAPIEQVATLLGHRSPGSTAEDLALDWAKEADHR
jgi:integrase/recombinase XerC